MNHTPEQILIENFRDRNGYWAEIPEHPVEDWRSEVTNDDTREGYHDWCLNRLYNQEPLDKPPCTHEGYRIRNHPDGGTAPFCPACGTFIAL